MPSRFWSTHFLAEIFDHVTQNASKSRFWSTFKLFECSILIHSNNKRWTKIAYSNHVIDKLFQYTILVYILLFEWTKIATSKSFESHDQKFRRESQLTKTSRPIIGRQNQTDFQ